MARRKNDRSYNKETHNYVIEKIKEGVPQKEIAEELGIARYTINNWAKEEGLRPKDKKEKAKKEVVKEVPMNSRGFTAEFKDRCLDEVRKGSSQHSVAKKYNISITSLNKWVKDARLANAFRVESPNGITEVVLRNIGGKPNRVELVPLDHDGLMFRIWR